MKIAFYAPFKPLGHKNPSGDLIIGSGLVQFLEKQGHSIDVQSTLRARWIYFKPWLWLVLILDFIQSFKKLKQDRPDVWLTYHAYYKAPDLLGPWICRLLNIKYVIFQGIYSTKRKKRLKTILGFYLNRAALSRADYIFTNKRSDLKNLKRLIPGERLSYIKPGIMPGAFEKDEWSGSHQRKKWGIREDCPVILSAAMFRDDVKTQGLSWLMRCCSTLVKQNQNFHLVIAGSGKMEKTLQDLAQALLPGQVTFAGKLHREKMSLFYSSGDLFAFPGIRESLGMVFLEAQSCCLPVVAFDNGGIPEVVVDNQTGYLVPMYDCAQFSDRLNRLLTDRVLNKQMGKKARAHVQKNHDMAKNYETIEKTLYKVIA